MNKFCYWQEDIPQYLQIQQLLPFQEKICLFRQNEFQFNKQVNIFCPYVNIEEAGKECPEYRVTKYFEHNKENTINE